MKGMREEREEERMTQKINKWIQSGILHCKNGLKQLENIK